MCFCLDKARTTFSPFIDLIKVEYRNILKSAGLAQKPQC